MIWPDDYIDKVICSDCLTIMAEMPDGSVDMILCDLPYGLTQNKWDSPIDLGMLWLQYENIIKPNGVIALTASQPFSSMLVMSNLEMFRHEWIWIKNRGSNFANTVREPFKEHEHVLIFSKGGWTYNKQMQKRAKSGADRIKYDFNHVTGSENYRQFERPPNPPTKLRCPSSWQKFNIEIGEHPTQKPVDLFAYLIKTYTNEGDLVLDNCIGSGTTAVAALRTGRHFIGIDIEESYCEIARQRIAEEKQQLGFDFGG